MFELIMPGFVATNKADKMHPRPQMLDAILNSHLLLVVSHMQMLKHCLEQWSLAWQLSRPAVITHRYTVTTDPAL